MTTKYLTKDLKCDLDDHSKRITLLEKNDALQDERIMDLRKDVAEICADHKTYELWRDDVNKILTTSQGAIRFGTWIVAAFGVSVIALIWALITGQASVIFK